MIDTDHINNYFQDINFFSPESLMTYIMKMKKDVR